MLAMQGAVFTPVVVEEPSKALEGGYKYMIEATCKGGYKYMIEATCKGINSLSPL